MPRASQTEYEYVYDPADPGNSPSYRPPETVWVEGDHPTENPDGVTVSNVDYYPKTQEEKAELLGVQMVDPIEVPPEEPYPEGEAWESREALLNRIHSPMELVEAKDYAEAHERNLAAGGSVKGSNPGLSQADLQRDEGSPGTRRGGGSVR